MIQFLLGKVYSHTTVDNVTNITITSHHQHSHHQHRRRHKCPHQEEANIHIAKFKGPRQQQQLRPSTGRICGRLKLSISYSKDALKVAVHHGAVVQW